MNSPTSPPQTSVDIQKSVGQLFYEEEGIKILRQMCVAGDMYDTSLRSIVWRVFLNVLDQNPEKWIVQCKKSRELYEQLRKKYVLDPETESEKVKIDLDDPLNQNDDSAWNKFFQNEELKKEISMDIVRTYQGEPFFEQRWVRDMMSRILFIYAKDNSGVLYIQGMNEILAPLLFVMDSSKVVPNLQATRNKDGISPFQVAMDAAYIEHDTYTLFQSLLILIGRWFSLPKREIGTLSSIKSVIVKSDNLATNALRDEQANNQIMNHCRYIHNTLLSSVDPQLAGYLRDLTIDPHLYMLRWIRILLAQVFPLEDLIIIWDAIFGWGRQVELLDWLCVAMLEAIRHLILGKDFSHCMQTLFNYPQISDPKILVTTALHLYDKYNRRKIREGSPSVSIVPQLENQSTGLHSTTLGPKKVLQSGLNNLKKIFVVDDPDFEITRLRTAQLHTANRLDRIIYILENTPSEESLRSVVAELCQIRSIMAGSVYPNNMTSLPPQSG
eukprot:TRINITY_DN6295_c0_g1_i1.p1 TRINITY_DN6295_c0_g1~~TRINITY_DN6295_c0_g1_i1.p1  ORF type:complete len:498 (-),score=54.67 TRINITY_DN6295_c0_g1_i1:74-1567(-)